MFKFRRALKYLLKSKNSQIKTALDRAEAVSCENRILSAYIAFIASRYGVVRIPKKDISEALGRFGIITSSDKDDYIIEVFELPDSGRVSGGCSAKK